MTKTYPVITICHKTDHISVECAQDDRDDAFEIAKDHADTICQNKDANTDETHYVTKSTIYKCGYYVWQRTGEHTGIKLFTVRAIETDHNL